MATQVPKALPTARCRKTSKVWANEDSPLPCLPNVFSPRPRPPLRAPFDAANCEACGDEDHLACCRASPSTAGRKRVKSPPSSPHGSKDGREVLPYHRLLSFLFLCSRPSRGAPASHAPMRSTERGMCMQQVGTSKQCCSRAALAAGGLARGCVSNLCALVCVLSC